MELFEELMILAGVPLKEAEEMVTLPNENSLGKRITPRNNQSVLKNFWNWFADSKIKDAQGRPLVLYHGTDYSFTQFEMTGEVEFPSAAYFTSKRALAKTYGSNVMPVYLKMSNPYVINAEGKTFNDFYEQMAEDMHYAKDNGFDGVIIRNLRDDWGQNDKRGLLADTYAVFDSSQIKSVENGGYYDVNSKNIYEAETPMQQLPNLNLNYGKIIPDDDPVKLRNFWNWFGNSTTAWKGQPMVFYHGTQSQGQGNKQAAFSSFDKAKLGKHSHFSSKVGFFFTSSEMLAGEFGSHVMAVYLKMVKPKIYSSGKVSTKDTELEQKFYDAHKSTDEYAALAPLKAMRAHTDAYDAFVADIYHRNGAIPFVRNLHNSFEDAVDIRGKEDEFITKYIASLKSEGYDSIIIRNTVADTSKNFGEPTTQYCVFDPEQIKSVNNNGGFSPASSNIFEEKEMVDMDEAAAYAGSRRDYDQPSLDAIGTGEGIQGHGWGLYYALNPDIAEIYRKSFTENQYENVWEILGEDLTEFLGDLLNDDTRDMMYRFFDKTLTPDSSTARGNLLSALYDIYQFYATRFRNQQNQRDKELAEEALEKRDYAATLRPSDFSIGVGVVHKVEIPDLKFLLDEQEKIGQQADYIQQRLSQILKDLNTGNLKDYSELSGKEFYKLLSDKLGTPKKASFLLYKYGIKGIHYVGAEDGECVVIFNPEDLRVLKRFYGGNGIEMERIGG